MTHRLQVLGYPVLHIVSFCGSLYLHMPRTPKSDPKKLAYTLDEVAQMTGFSRRTMGRLFEGQPGVLVLERPTTMSKRRYRSLRIPRAVYERVIRTLALR